ncbi:hypothetical protein CPC16_003698, partial [Podila verticillata]
NNSNNSTIIISNKDSFNTHPSLTTSNLNLNNNNLNVKDTLLPINLIVISQFNNNNRTNISPSLNTSLRNISSHINLLTSLLSISLRHTELHDNRNNNNSNNNNSNNNSFVPLIPVRQQSANIPLVTSTTSSPSVNHPLEPTTKTETIENLQPPRGFGFDSTYNNNDRPHSVASISNLSTHSNEPLNPSKKTTPNRKYSKKGSRMNYNNKARPATQSRSVTPQPWHPDYNRGGKNPLDLPEQKKRMGRLDDDSEGDDFNPQDDHGDDDRRKSYPESGKTRNKPRFFSRMRDRLRTKVPPDYKVTGTGRLAQFSNERLYLHWIRFGILQGGVAVMLLSYGIGIASYIGVGALVLALSTLIYCTTLYHLRHLYMITKRKDAIYFERWIPSLLTVGLFALYLANLILTIIYPKASRNPPPWTTYGSPFEGRGAV